MRDAKHVCWQWDGRVKTQGKTAVHKLRSEALEETKPADTFILNF